MHKYSHIIFYKITCLKVKQSIGSFAGTFLSRKKHHNTIPIAFFWGVQKKKKKRSECWESKKTTITHKFSGRCAKKGMRMSSTGN